MPAQTPVPQDPTDAVPQTQSASSAPGAKPPGARGPRALVVPMNRILRTGAIAAAIALPLAALVGYVVDGVPGAWGGLLGMGIAVVFFAVTVVVALATARTKHTSMLGLAVVASWVIKVALLIVALVFLRGADFYSRPVLFVFLLVGTIGTLVIEARVVATTQVPYVEIDRS
jgi:hypothetical protein